jgi:hypothetical protein
MYRWRFEQFTSATERKAISDWRRNVLSPARRAIFDTFLDRIAKMESWTTEICRPLKGRYSGRWELRWTAEKVEHRIFGYYSGPKVFVMLIGCTHKGKIYDPPGAFETMMDRLRKLQTGQGGLSEYAFPK